MMNRLVLAAALSLGVASRAAIHFSTPLAPRVNGAYYFVQVRSLMEAGHLAIPDLPLLFWIQGAAAFVIQFVAGLDQEQAIILACKTVDCVAPAFLAVPVYILLGRWRNTGTSSSITAAVLVLSVVHAPLLSMTSQYEKNSLGLVWFAAFTMSLREVMFTPSRRAAIAIPVFLVLAGLTHIGVFGATILLGTLVLMAGLVFLPGQRKYLLALAGASVCVTIVVMLVTWYGFDAQRTERLAHVLLPGNDPVAGAVATPPVPAPLPVATSVHSASHNSTSLLPLLFLALVPMVLVHAMAIGALLIVWRQRGILPRGECVFVAATAITALILAWPFAISERAVRFQMIAVAPLVLLTPFVLTHWRSRRSAKVVATGVLVATISSLGFTVSWKIEPSIPAGSYAELKSLQSHIADPPKTLIIAPHGLEWWVVWALRTKIAHANAVRPGDWQKYTVVDVLTQKRRNEVPGGMQQSAGNKPTTHRDESRRVFDEFDVPADAESLADGPNFRLVRLTHPPLSLPSK